MARLSFYSVKARTSQTSNPLEAHAFSGKSHSILLKLVNVLEELAFHVVPSVVAKNPIHPVVGFQNHSAEKPVSMIALG